MWVGAPSYLFPVTNLQNNVRQPWHQPEDVLPAFSKMQVSAFLFAALTKAVPTPIKLPEGCCFKAWVEVSDSHNAQMHISSVCVCLCTQMLTENGEGQAREGACASPLQTQDL